MTFYDSFIPYHDPLQQGYGYRNGRSSLPSRRNINPYGPMYHHPVQTNYFDPAHTLPKQRFQRGHKEAPLSQRFYTSQAESDDDEYEEEQLGQFLPTTSSPMRDLKPKSDQSFSPTNALHDGVNIPIRRTNQASTTHHNNVKIDNAEIKSKFGNLPSDSKNNRSKNSGKDREDKVIVDRSVLSHLEEEPLIIELPVNEIPPTPPSLPYLPGRFEYVWEGEENEDVIETIIDCAKPVPMEIERVQDETNLQIPSKETPSSDELKLWEKELGIFEMVGFTDASVLLPLLKEKIGDPSAETILKKKGIQEVLRILLCN